MPRRARFLLALLLFAFTARAEFPVTEERALAPTLGISGNARVVATDSGFLAFWRTADSHVQVGRFSPDGILERRAAAWELPASFTWYDAESSGDQVLLAGWCEGTWDGTLCLARFSAGGDFLGLIRTPFARPSAPVVASDGDGFLVVFAAPVPGWTVLALPVSPDGTAGDAAILGRWDQFSHWPSAAAIDGTYFVSFGTAGGHVLTRLSATGVEASVPLSTPGGQVRIESSGDRLLVVTTPTTAVNPGMRAAVFDRDLVRTTDWLALDGGNSMPRIVPTASGWIVAAEGATGATMLPISRAGVAGQFSAVPGVRGFVIDAAGRADRAALVWPTEADLTVPDFRHNAVKLAIFNDAAVPVREPATISLGPAPQIHPAAAHGNGVTMAAWVERTPDGRFVVNARPFDANGAPLAPTISMPYRGVAQLRPAVAFDGASFFVVWSEGPAGVAGVYGARVAADGTLLDPEGIALFGGVPLSSSTYRTADVDWSGSAWIVASSNELRQLVAARVSPGGAMLDVGPRAISTMPEYGSAMDFAPVVECNGAECLIAWHGPPVGSGGCQITCPTPPFSIRAAIITPDLEVRHRLPPLTEPWEEPSSDFRSLDASWNDIAGAWLVSWSFAGHQRIARDGAFLGPRDVLGYGGSTSSIPEREGWRIVWATYRQPDLFHGWTNTAEIAEIRERSVLAASDDDEWDARAVDAPRPLALFLRESRRTAGSPEVVGRFLDESPAPTIVNLNLTATRLTGGDLRLDWTTNLDEVSYFVVSVFRENFSGGDGWYGVGNLVPSVRHFFLTPGMMSYATRIVVTAGTPSGLIQSNVFEVVRPRRRAVAR